MGRRARPVGLDGPFVGSEALADGAVTRAQLRGPSVRRLFQGVYLPAGHPADHGTRSAAATLVLPEHAVVTGRSALTVRGAGVAGPQDPVEVAVPHGSGLRPIRGVTLLRSDLRDDESVPWESARLAHPHRAALDLCRRRELPDVVADLDRAARAGLLDPVSWARWLVGRHDKGVVVARRAAELVDARAESPPESHVRVHLVEAGLSPEPQLVVHCADGRTFRLDLGFAQHKVAVEYDGLWHAARDQLQADRTRLNALHAQGWVVVHVTAADLRTPGRVVAMVVAALESRRP